MPSIKTSASLSSPAARCASVVLKPMESLRVQQRLQSPVRGTKTSEAHPKLMGAFGLIRFKHRRSIVDNLLGCRAEDLTEGHAAALATFDIWLLGLGGGNLGACLWYFEQQPVAPLRLGHGR